MWFSRIFFSIVDNATLSIVAAASIRQRWLLRWHEYLFIIYWKFNESQNVSLNGSRRRSFLFRVDEPVGVEDHGFFGFSPTRKPIRLASNGARSKGGSLWSSLSTRWVSFGHRFGSRGQPRFHPNSSTHAHPRLVLFVLLYSLFAADVKNRYSRHWTSDDSDVEVFPKFIPSAAKKIIVDDNDGKTWEVGFGTSSMTTSLRMDGANSISVPNLWRTLHKKVIWLPLPTGRAFRSIFLEDEFSIGAESPWFEFGPDSRRSPQKSRLGRKRHLAQRRQTCSSPQSQTRRKLARFPRAQGHAGR